MGAFDTSNIMIGPGTLYAAPLGTTEPTSAVGSWPANWWQLGFTDQGSSFTFGPTAVPLYTEDQPWPLEQAITGYTGTMSFVLAESTRQNLALALNAGIGSSTVGTSQGSNGDGSLWQEMPVAGAEVRVMLGWDSASQYGTQSNSYASRIIVRQALQTGTVTRQARKGNNKSTYSCQFSLEIPLSGVQPFRYIEVSVMESDEEFDVPGELPMMLG